LPKIGVLSQQLEFEIFFPKFRFSSGLQKFTKPAIRRRRGGVKRISGLIYEQIRGQSGSFQEKNLDLPTIL